MTKFIAFAVLFFLGGATLLAQTQATATVTVTAQVEEQPASVTVTPNPIEFGTLDPSEAGQNRFRSAVANCAWVAPLGTTWSIEVSTANNNHYPGIVDTTGAHFLPLKFNNSDLGPNLPNVDANWTGDSASFLWVFDPTDDADGPGSDGATSTFTMAVNQADIGNLDFYFAVEVADNAWPTSYFGVVTFDLIVDALP